MDEMDIKSKIESIELQIKNLTFELNSIRAICKHPEEKIIIKDINPSGTSEFRKVCGVCGTPLGWPTSKEILDWCT